jgi:hypothetical protein
MIDKNERIDDLVQELIETEPKVKHGKLHVEVFIDRYSDYFRNYDPESKDNELLEEWITRIAHGDDVPVDLVDSYGNIVDTVPPIMAEHRSSEDIDVGRVASYTLDRQGTYRSIGDRVVSNIYSNGLKDSDVITDMSMSVVDSYLDINKIRKHRSDWSIILNKYNREAYYGNKDEVLIKESNDDDILSTEIKDIDVCYD